MYGYVRVGAAVPRLKLADCTYNKEQIVAMAKEAAVKGIRVLTFPELCITGYTCADLFMQRPLLVAAEKAIKAIASETADLNVFIVVGAPVPLDSQAFNCAVAIYKGEILGMVPKTHLPNYSEFAEERWFSSADDILVDRIRYAGQEVPIGSDLLFAAAGIPDLKIGIEICEDLWVPIPPSSYQALYGATVLLNLSASNELSGKAHYRRRMVAQHSSSCIAEVFKNPDFAQSVWVSLKIALWSAVFACILGVALSMALIKTRKAKGGTLYAIRLPVLVPHAVVALFVVQICGQTGLLARLGYAFGLLEDYNQFPQLLYTPSYFGTILAYLWKEIPFVAYFVLAFMSSISETLGEAAENLGASPLRSFFEITLPLSLGVISKAFLIIFIFAFGGYELPLLLGATIPKALSVQTYLSYMSPDLLQRPLAMAMNGTMLLLSAGLAGLYGLVITGLNRKIGGHK